MNTYPEMNQKIVGLLRMSGTAYDLYAAARIEELEALAAKLMRGCFDNAKLVDDCVDAPVGATEEAK